MSLINCPECGKKISDKAPACPFCGRPMEPIFGTKFLKFLVWALAAFVAITAVSGLGFGLWRKYQEEREREALIKGLAERHERREKIDEIIAKADTDPEKIIISHKDDFKAKEKALMAMGELWGAYTHCHRGAAKNGSPEHTAGGRAEHLIWIEEKHTREEAWRLHKVFSESVDSTFFEVDVQAGPPVFNDEACAFIKAAFDRYILE